MTTYRFNVCPMCGIHYAVDEAVMAYKQELPASDKDRGWYCPNGHSLIYTESLAEKYRRESERLKQQLSQRDDTIIAEAKRADLAEKSVARLKKRAAAGTCPCCSRSFQNMSRHMKTKHPDFSAQPRLKVVS